MKTITLTPNHNKDVITNCNNKLVVAGVTTFRVGNKLIWIEYNDGESVIAVNRSDYATMVVTEMTNVTLRGEGFERINCETRYANESNCDF